MMLILGAVSRFGQGAVNMWTPMTVHGDACLLTIRTRTWGGPVTKIGNCDCLVEIFSSIMHDALSPDSTLLPRSAGLTTEAWRPQTLSHREISTDVELPLSSAAGTKSPTPLGVVTIGGGGLADSGFPVLDPSRAWPQAFSTRYSPS
jgi:hypothetical protein